MENLTLFNTIKPDLLRRQLFKGSIMAITGAVILLWSGTMLPEETLSHWGIPLFFFSSILIGFGLLPYRKLSRLENNPYKLELTGEGELLFFRGRDLLASLPADKITRLNYKEDSSCYGIAIWLKNPEALNLPRNKKFDCDLFLPYFSERSFKELEGAVKPI